jgi:hypothetical protein
VSATYLGSLSIGGAMPGGVAVAAAGAAGINATLPDLESRLASLLSWTPTPIVLTAQISALEAMISAIQAQITLGVPAPSLVTQLANLAALVADLSGLIASVQLQLEIVTDFQGWLGAAGVHAFAYDGAVGDLPASLLAALAGVPGLGPADHANAVALVTTVPATWAALSNILKVSP